MEPHQTSSYYPPSPIRLISNSRSSFRRDPYHRPDPRPSSGPALLPPLSFYDPSPRYHNNNHHNNHNNNDQHNNDHHHHHHQDSRIFQSIPTITPNFPRPHPMGTHQSPVVLPIQTSFDHMRMRTTSESLPAHHVHHHHHVQKVPTEVSYQEEEYIREDPSVRYENRMDLSHPSSSPATIPQLDRQSSSLFERMSHAPTKGKWKKEEDAALFQLALAHGQSRWKFIARFLGSKSAKQCRDRWQNQLNPNINKSPWTPEEDQRLFHLNTKLGNKWAKIATFFPGRTPNAIKNHMRTRYFAQMKASVSGNNQRPRASAPRFG